jgi:hypothetical protein
VSAADGSEESMKASQSGVSIYARKLGMFKAGELEAYSHNQGLFVVWRFERHSDGGRVVTRSMTSSQSEGPQDNET